MLMVAIDDWQTTLRFVPGPNNVGADRLIEREVFNLLVREFVVTERPDSRVCDLLRTRQLAEQSFQCATIVGWHSSMALVCGTARR
jgi:hypothetical protein